MDTARMAVAGDRKMAISRGWVIGCLHFFVDVKPQLVGKDGKTDAKKW